VDLFGSPSNAAAGAPVRHVTLEQLLRHKWLALAVFVAFSVPAAAAVWLLHVPMYEARAGLYVAPSKPKIAYRTEDNRGNYGQHRNDQAVNLRSPEVLNRVLDDAEVKQTRWYNEKPRFALGGPPSRLDRLRDSLSVSTPRLSSFVWVAMRCSDPGEAKLIANKVVQECEVFVANDYDSDDEAILKVQLEGLQKLDLDVRALRSDIANLLVSSGLYTEDPEALVQQKVLSLNAKREQLKELQRQLQLAHRELERQQTGQSATSQPSELPTTSQPTLHTLRAADPEWRRLHEARVNADFAARIGQQRLGQSHPEMIQLRAAAEHALERLQAYEEEMDRRPTAPLSSFGADGTSDTVESMSLGALETYVEDLESQVVQLEAEIEGTGNELSRIRSQIEDLKKQQDELRHKNEEADAYRKAALARKTERQAPPWIKKRDAVTPSQPVNTRRRYMLMGMAVFGGLALGLAAAYLRASTSQAIHEAADLLGPVETPFLGYLPQVRDPADMSPAEQAVQTEYVRMVRTALLDRIDGRAGSAVMVSSAGSGAGKTTVALLLAESLTSCGKRVLLVDADLRNSAISKRYGIPTKPGLVGVLTDLVSDADAIARRGVGGLDILPAGALEKSQDQELLANGMLSARLERWRERYDVVVFDAPPVIPVADARILARQVDGTVLVVREGHCRRDDVIEALAALSTSGGRLLGTVFVGSPGRRGYGSYYSRHYRTAANTSEAPDAQAS